VLAVAAFRRISQARRRTSLPITFLFTPDEELGSPATHSVIERKAAGIVFFCISEFAALAADRPWTQPS
jgi:glutamate carboxypeptidase